MIADKLSRHGWTWGTSRHLTKHGFLWCVDAYKTGDPRKFVVKAEELTTAFLELERQALDTSPTG